MLTQLRENSPLRPPDWRWQKVAAYRQVGRRIPRSAGDKLLSKLFRFSEAIDGCTDDFQLLEVYEQFPIVSDAYDIYKKEAATSTRWEIEARILAREDYDSISAKTSVPAETISIFEKGFFNVKDRLSNKSWVINSVIGRSVHVGMTERDYDLLWKLYGLLGGPNMLDLIMTKVGLKEQHADNFEQAVSLLRDSLDVQSVVKSSVALAVIAVNNYTAIPIVQAEQAYRQLARDSAGAASTQTFLQSVDKIMTSLPWSTGDGTIKHPVLEVLGHTDNLAAELRADEMVCAVSGESFPELQDMRLPEPEEKNANQQAK